MVAHLELRFPDMIVDGMKASEHPKIQEFLDFYNDNDNFPPSQRDTSARRKAAYRRANPVVTNDDPSSDWLIMKSSGGHAFADQFKDANVAYDIRNLDYGVARVAIEEE